MSERMTSVVVRGLNPGSGWSDYGRKDPAEMIATLRAHAERDKAVAERILSAPDSEFVVETYTGIIVRRNVETLWPKEADRG